MSEPVLVIWDVDDVLNQLMREWFECVWLGDAAGHTLGYSDLVSNPPYELLGIDEPRYLASLDRFRGDHYARLRPRPEVVEWFQAHGGRAHHLALTAVPTAYAHLSASWVVEHFGQWIRTFAFVPSRRTGDSVDRHSSKQDYLRWLGRGDLLVDDRPENVAAARSVGLSGVLIPQPWNIAAAHPIGMALDQVAAAL